MGLKERKIEAQRTKRKEDDKCWANATSLVGVLYKNTHRRGQD